MSHSRPASLCKQNTNMSSVGGWRAPRVNGVGGYRSGVDKPPSPFGRLPPRAAARGVHPAAFRGQQLVSCSASAAARARPAKNADVRKQLKIATTNTANRRVFSCEYPPSIQHPTAGNHESLTFGRTQDQSSHTPVAPGSRWRRAPCLAIVANVRHLLSPNDCEAPTRCPPPWLSQPAFHFSRHRVLMNFLDNSGNVCGTTRSEWHTRTSTHLCALHGVLSVAKRPRGQCFPRCVLFLRCLRCLRNVFSHLRQVTFSQTNPPRFATAAAAATTTAT